MKKIRKKNENCGLVKKITENEEKIDNFSVV